MSLLLDGLRHEPDLPRHVFLCVADHFEPDWGWAPAELRLARVNRWLDQYPESVAGIHDSLGRPPQHTFFFPLERYEPGLLDRLAQLCHRGFGDVEVHLHHDNDSSQQLRDKLEWFKETLHSRHGLLRRHATGEVTYGFVHGNWALDNSRPDGKWCGVNDEISVLRETGCYADFTMPSAPDHTQTRTINSIYYSLDDPERPKSHDTGIPARVGAAPPEGALLMIQGPLALDWYSRKCGPLPRLENSSLDTGRHPSDQRFRLWERANVTVAGRPDWRFIKLHTHGAKEPNADVLLGSPMRSLHESLAWRACEHPDFKYYYVTAYEMAQLVHAAEKDVRVPAEVLSIGPRRDSTDALSKRVSPSWRNTGGRTTVHQDQSLRP